MLAYGVGDVTPTDLFHAQVEVEENHATSVMIYCFGESPTVGVDSLAKDWLRENIPANQCSPIPNHL